MKSTWLRMIDSAQRRVTFETCESLSVPGIEKIVFHIQGLQVVVDGQPREYLYSDMADLGIAQGFTKPLTVWQRLWRQPTPLGTLQPMDRHHAVMTFWCEPKLDLVLPLHDAEVADQWRECEIMVMSAGFHWLTLPPVSPEN